ncbi:NAD(P)-dependent oxidoreductase [Martelella soudanensis]|uniref:NAD(P)-dependent oxidoreductase n=1 Tax=unclassified Martelella TaxID=2629616 RepID=UPI0015E0101B|nr:MULTISPECIES: NAD(P)-dependent oxidoreductase [unclassified Martelella]
METIGFIGFGEAARAISDGWAEAGVSASLAAFDVKTLDAGAAETIAAACDARGVFCAPALSDMLARSDIVFSLVTADNALVAAETAAAALRPGMFYLDGNSCSPETKRRASRLIGGAGGSYADVAIMSPIYPKLHRTPCLVSGPAAEAAARTMSTLGMEATAAGPQIGDASSVKMIRSVMIKGTEALMAECFLAAEKAGVTAQVLASLSASDPAIDWPAKSAYCLERMMVHGKRRAAEMREVMATLEELGITPRMAAAAAVWQDAVGHLGLAAGEPELAERTALILAAMDEQESGGPNGARVAGQQ